MKKSETLSSKIVEAYENGEFGRRAAAEKEILSKHSYETLLSMAASMSVYINSVWPIIEKQIPLANQAYLNGMQSAIKGLARQGGNAKSKRYSEHILETEDLVRAKQYPSIRNAAQSIKPKILQLGKTIGVPLSESQAENTINGWIVELVNSGKIPPFPTQNKLKK